MPLWNSIQKDFGEHTPLSTHDDDEEEPPLPPYSDNPMTPTLSSRSAPYSDNPSPPANGNGSNGAAVRRTNGRTNGSSSSSSAHKAVTVQEDEYYEDDEDQGFGEGDFFSSGRGNNNNYSSTPSKHKRHNTPRYRTGLVCAYLQYIVTCCGACSFLGAGRARRIFMCLFYTILFVTIMVCASSIGYIIARDGSPFAPDAIVVDDVTSSSTGTTTDGVAIGDSGGKTFDNQKTTATTTSTTNKLPPPPSNLHDICTDYITTSGRQKCEKECSMAECCHFPATNKDHCWEEQAEDCATYRAACMGLELSNSNGGSSSGGTSGSGGATTLDVVTILDAPPSNLHIACSSSSLETPEGFDMCAGLCRPSRCCYPDKFGCKVADDRYCDDYEDLCANVAESWRGSGHAVAPSSGTSTSSSSTTASQTTSIANEVMQACNAANLNPPYQCMEACKKGACCYVSSQYPPIEMLYDHYDGPENNPLRKVNNCASNNGFCQQYGSCEHLNHMKDVAGWNSDEVQYVLDVSTPCKAEHIAQFGALECSNLCQPAHCCFSGEYECDDVQLGHLNCDDYEACQVLYPSKKGTTKDLLKLAESIDEVCSAASLKTIGGRSECQNLCIDHLCCFYQDGCTNDPDKNCLAYAGCEAYYKLPTDGGAQVNANNNIDAGSSAGSSLGIDELVTALEDACSEESLTTINGIYECHNKCQAHLCCFTADSKVAQQDCSSERPVACSAYEPCKRLVTPAQGAQSIKSLEPDDIQKIVFDACFFGNDPLKITDQMVTKCHGVCAQRLCCFSDDKLQSSCRATVGNAECELYSLCEQLITSNGGEALTALGVKEIESDVTHLCTKKVSEDQNLYNACRDICIQKRSCCFDGPSYSCYEMENEWCDEYKACEVADLHFPVSVITNTGGANNGGGVVPYKTPEQIEKAVYDACYFGTDESKVTQELVQKCHDVCASRFCCFDSYKIGPSCRASVGDEECELYAECEQLINKSGGVVKTFIELDELEFDTDTTSNGNSASGPGSTVQFPSGQTGINIESEVDSFVTSLENACSESSLKTLDGIQKCHSKCQTHLCCFTTDSKLADQDCSGLLPAACSAYAPCKRLVTPPSGNEIVPSTSLSGPELTEKAVYDACYFGDDPSRVTQELVTRCHDVCATRLCCFSDYKLRSSCRATVGEEECNLYSLCDQLVSEGGGEMKDALELEEKEFDIDKLCTDEVASNSNLYSACRESCERRSCCFETEQVYSCYNLEKDWCDEYKACSLVEYNFYDGSSAGNLGNAVEIVSSKEHDLDASIESVCSQDSFKTLEGIERCFNKCQAHLCCFPEDAAEMKWDCEDDFGDEECDAYANCEQLVAFHNLWKPPPKTLDKFAVKIAVNDACILKSGQQPTEQWVSNCHQKCETRLCCLVDPSIRSSCLDALGEEECSDYSACKVLIGGDSREAEQIEDVCGNVNDANSFAKCETKCKTRQCCFEDVHDFSCYHLEKEWCNEYEACGIVGLKFSSPPTVNAPSQGQSQSLINQNTITAPTPSITTSGMTNNYGSGSPPTLNSVTNQGDSDSELLILARACSSDQLDTDATECRMLCKGSECCFTSHVENNCSRQSGMQAFCLAHMLCASLFSS